MESYLAVLGGFGSFETVVKLLKLLAFLSLPRDSAAVVLNEDEPYERRDALC